MNLISVLSCQFSCTQTRTRMTRKGLNKLLKVCSKKPTPSTHTLNLLSPYSTVINRAWKILENEKTRKRCLEIVDEAKEFLEHTMTEKRKKLKKEGKDTRLDEDDPIKYRRTVYVMTMKLFADMERKRRELDQRDMEERKRKREREIEEEEKAKVDKEWQKNYEESREGRVNSWQKFQATKTKKSKGSFKPPKHKQEQR